MSLDSNPKCGCLCEVSFLRWAVAGCWRRGACGPHNSINHLPQALALHASFHSATFASSCAASMRACDSVRLMHAKAHDIAGCADTLSDEMLQSLWEELRTVSFFASAELREQLRPQLGGWLRSCLTCHGGIPLRAELSPKQVHHGESVPCVRDIVLTSLHARLFLPPCQHQRR